MRFLTNDDVAALVTPAEALTTVRAAYREMAAGSAAVQARVRTEAGHAKLSTLGAVLAGEGVLGAKVYSTVAGRFSFLVVLFSAEDGRRLAVLESDALTRLRTAATSVLAAQQLGPPAPDRLVVFGTGAQATGHVEAFHSAFELGETTIIGRRSEVDARAAVGRADLVVTATRATEAVFPGAWLREGAHVTAVGTSRTDARELDDEAYRRAGCVAVEWIHQARVEAGGLVHAVAAGVLGWDRVVELADLVAGREVGRAGAGDITVFQSVGIGLADVAVGALALRKAEAGPE